jgi:CYTH domain-containing protein
MAKEIERKFLVLEDSYKKLGAGIFCVQGYICHEVDRVVRIRAYGEKGYLTIKGKNEGFTREEFEYEIPVEDARFMLENYCAKDLIKKIRYEILFQGFHWIVDEFEGENKGLVLAEIELLDEAGSFLKPSWIGQEVSFDFRYTGTSLSKNPFKDWGG